LHALWRWQTSSHVQAKKVKNTTGNYKPGTFIFQNLRTISAEEIKKAVKLLEEADEQYSEMAEGDEGAETEEPAVLRELFPPCKEEDELNIADVLVTCNFLFRDA
jgi:ATP-dependent DNA helicase 2 subunit 1